MDNNNSDPNTPSPQIPGLSQGSSVPPTDPANAPWQTQAPTTPTQSMPVPGLDQIQVTPPTLNPLDNPSGGEPAQNPLAATTDPLGTSSQAPASPSQSAWPSSTSTAGFESAAPAQQTFDGATLTNPLSNPPPTSQATPSPLAANPFLQSQPPSPTGLSGSEPTAPEPVEPAQTPPALGLEQPTLTNTVPEPTSNSIDPTQGVTGGNPLQAPSIPLSQNPMEPGSLSASGETTNPLQPQTATSVEMPTSGQSSDQPAVPTPVPESPGAPALENPAPGTAISGQPGTLDLSSVQPAGPTPVPETPATPPNNALPEIGPQENAPTDLSHLIAGDESHQQPGDVYAPPVAQDQNPVVNPNQTSPATDGSTPPPGKHLNLTKVLLVAGIPIILIVAALSAYLILGIGKPAVPDTTNKTSLPVEQTKQQAPLTNPPQQIVAPSPVSIPEPQSQGVGLPSALDSTGSGTALPTASSSPTASLSPAMQAAQKKVSPSPSSASSASTTLP